MVRPEYTLLSCLESPKHNDFKNKKDEKTVVLNMQKGYVNQSVH